MMPPENVAYPPSATGETIVVGWAVMSPNFGTGLPHGSCTAIIREADGGVARVCGWPRREDGTCLEGHRQPTDDA